ncbi:MAG: FAD-dependent oxidoreductase [Oscillospiraceae bacterium]|nr:FAD-dependent oxidoreductase [Oscillospiraceae bacterium]
MPRVEINGNAYETEQGQSILDACLQNGIYVPHLCSHNELHPIGACRLCVVEIAGEDGLFPSCATLAEDGMEILTASEAVEETRKMAIELMLSGHQADCGTCIKYLNCELQSLKQYLIEDDLSVRRRSRLFPVTESNPIFSHEPNKCVLCGRCVRACRDLRGIGVLYYKHDHGEAYIGVGPDADEDISLAEAGCRFCGACAEVCPTGAVLDRDEFGQNKSRKEALLPCSNACPAEIDVPGYIRFIREGQISEAAALIRERVPFPLILGHICSHPCESSCRRGQIDKAMSICMLKRFAAENDAEQIWEGAIQKKAETGKRVAVIGAGPAGLSAGYYLTLMGHAVTVYEEMAEPGGMLRYGIPEYRLPLDVLRRELEDIMNLGVDIRTNARIESVEALLSEGYDAVLVAIGAHRGLKLKIPGSRGDGVLAAVEFLRSVRMGEAPDLGDRVMVLGGGSVAFDCARTAIRCGSQSVMVACLEPRSGMLATEEEINAAEQENVAIYPSRSFKRIIRDEGRVAGVELMDVKSFYYDEERKLNVETDDESSHVIDADMVIFAVGQLPDVPDDFGIELTDRGLVDADAMSFATGVEGVYAVADAVTGTDKAISAIAAGRKAALAIDKRLGGRGRLALKLASEVQYPARLGRRDGFAELARADVSRELPQDRVCDFRLVEHGFDAERAAYESGRCLQCDLRLKMKAEKFWSSY